MPESMPPFEFKGLGFGVGFEGLGFELGLGVKGSGLKV